MNRACTWPWDVHVKVEWVPWNIDVDIERDLRPNFNRKRVRCLETYIELGDKKGMGPHPLLSRPYYTEWHAQGRDTADRLLLYTFGGNSYHLKKNWNRQLQRQFWAKVGDGPIDLLELAFITIIVKINIILIISIHFVIIVTIYIILLLSC